jgi:hypothetical protein
MGYGLQNRFVSQDGEASSRIAGIQCQKDHSRILPHGSGAIPRWTNESGME